MEPPRDRYRQRAVTTSLRRIVAATLLSAGILGACQAASPPSLAGRTFLSVAITENGAPKALVAGTRIRLDFKDGAISANAGCNQMGGEFQLQNGLLVVANTFTTEMACDPERMAQDTWLLEVLGSKPRLTLTGDQLTIDAGRVVLHLADRRVVEPDLAITGPTWTVDSIFSGESVSSVPDGAVATLVFRADGTLDVDTSCNTGSARWQAVGTGIEVRDLGLTKKACIGPTGELESAILDTLRAGTIAADIDADRLLLRAGANGIGLRGR
jgi:heat shock protein HslJ